jgi:hypothetical protein
MSTLMARSPHSGRARMFYATSLGAVLVLAICLVLPAVVKAVPPKRSLGSGAWCWFADPRGVHYEGAHRRTYIGWVADDGDIKVAAFDHDSGVPSTVVLHSKLRSTITPTPLSSSCRTGELRCSTPATTEIACTTE